MSWVSTRRIEIKYNLKNLNWKMSKARKGKMISKVRQYFVSGEGHLSYLDQFPRKNTEK